MKKSPEAPTPDKPRRGRPPTLGPKMTKRYMIRCTPAEHARWSRIAALSDLELSEFSRRAINAATGRAS